MSDTLSLSLEMSKLVFVFHRTDTENHLCKFLREKDRRTSSRIPLVKAKNHFLQTLSPEIYLTADLGFRIWLKLPPSIILEKEAKVHAQIAVNNHNL